MESAEHRGASQDAEQQDAISAMVGGLIAKRGYYSVIDELVAAVYNLGEMSLADPDNSEKMRDFDMWAYAVRAAGLSPSRMGTQSGPGILKGRGSAGSLRRRRIRAN